MPFAIYGGFVVLVLVLVLLDLGVLTRSAHVIGTREALLRTSGWVSLALGFNVFIYFLYGHDWFDWKEVSGHSLAGGDAAAQFFAGYLLEQSLSVDNMMVIAIIFGFYRIPAINQHRVLLWGILGALVLRGIMIALGAVLIQSFTWVVYVFGAFLIVTAAKLLVAKEGEVHPERNLLFKIARRLYPISPTLDGDRFFTRVADGRRAMTPMFLALILVETSDVIFAVDSIPAIFAVTSDPFLVFTSNVFAILGLRSLYFALAGMLEKFRFLKTSLVFVLAFVGVKMILSHHFHIATWIALLIIGGILAIGIIASLVIPEPETGHEHAAE